MFAKAALLPIALFAGQISIPLGKAPRIIEQPKNPIERYGPLWAEVCDGADMEWDMPAPPVRVHGNTYYVGTCGITALLIAGTDGHILVDGGTEKGAEIVAANIARLGFNIRDVRYILTSHEHHDHAGAIGALQEMSGATVVASGPAARVLMTGKANSDDPQFDIFQPFPTAQVGRIVRGGEQIIHRGLMVEAIATPGHTSGAMSWRWMTCDGGMCRSVVYSDSLTPVSSDNYRFTDHPQAVAAFRASIAKIAATPCDILLTPHPMSSKMRQRFELGEVLLDPEGCKAFAAERTAQLDERLAKEAAGPAKP